MTDYMAYKSKPDFDVRSAHFDLTNTFSIHILPEGYTSQSAFEDDITKLLVDLTNVAPFNILNTSEVAMYNLCVYQYWPGPVTSPIPSMASAPTFTTSTIPSLYSTPPDSPSPHDYEFDSIISKQSAPGGGYVYDFYINETKIRNIISNLKAPIVDKNAVGGETYINVEPYLQKRVFFSDGANNYYGTQNSVVIILLPDANYVDTGSSTPLNNDGLRIDGKDKYDIYVTSVNNYAGAFLARAIATNYGLVEETIDSDPGNDHPTSDYDISRITAAPNLFYNTGLATATTYTPDLTFKWKNITANSSGSPVVNVHNTLPTTITSQTYRQLELWIGGGSFQNQVYRAAPDCLMHRRLSSTGIITPATLLSANRVKDKVGFCLACQQFLSNKINSNNYAGILLGHKTLTTQKLAFDEITWQSQTVETSGFSPISYSTHPAGFTNEEFWAFDVTTDSVNGLTISNIRVLQQQRDPSHIDTDPTTGNLKVINVIKFQNLSVRFTGDTSDTSFPVSSVFSGATVQRILTNNSTSILDKNLYQRGVKLSMVYDFGNTCKVTVELSVVFRGIKNDFDPGSTANALKIYPQISFKWEPVDFDVPGRKTVEKFYGEIYLEGTTKHAASNPTCSGVKNHIELFTDTNYLFDTEMLTRMHKYYAIPGIPNLLYPQWSALFDYYKAYVDDAPIDNNLVFPFEYVAVYGPDTPDKFNSNRGATITNSYLGNFAVNKVRRQGAYDNMHVTGDMENYDVGNWTNIQLVAAPFCAEDCLHSHWRWGEIANYITLLNAPLSPFSYMGWMPDVDSSVANCVAQQPLIPPNQSLSVHVDRQISGLYDTLKKITYKCTIMNPAADCNNVVLEAGMAWAARVADISIVRMLFSTPANQTDPVSSSLNDYQFMRQVYDRIRFSNNNDTSSTLVPLGYVPVLYNGSNVKLEEL